LERHSAAGDSMLMAWGAVLPNNELQLTKRDHAMELRS
jgi:hypothetical protein